MDFSACKNLLVRWRVTDLVLDIAFNRPKAKNSFHDGVIEEYLHVLDTAKKLPKLRALTIRGEGEGFSAGGDIHWLEEGCRQSFDENLKSTTRLSHLFETLLAFPVPVIGSVHGFAIGGAVGFLSGCDTVIATEDTRFSLGEARIGLIPACVAPVLIRKLGASPCHHLMLTGERISAKRAYEIGLIHEVAANREILEKRIDYWVQEVLQNAPGATREAKQLLLHLSKIEAKDQEHASLTLARLRASPEAKEGVASFTTKSVPSWRARS